MEIPLETLQYPVGRFSWPKEVTQPEITAAIETLSKLPYQMRQAVSDLNDNQLDTPYRSGGWTIRQVVHHVADSHMNAYFRFKLALTEDNPTIKPYEEARWAELSDSKLVPEISLLLLENIHARWVTIMIDMQPGDWDRTFLHPQYNMVQSLRKAVTMYQWHSNHHRAHITTLRDRMGWH